MCEVSQVCVRECVWSAVEHKLGIRHVSFHHPQLFQAIAKEMLRATQLDRRCCEFSCSKNEVHHTYWAEPHMKDKLQWNFVEHTCNISCAFQSFCAGFLIICHPLVRLDLEHLVVSVNCDLPCREQLLEHLGAVRFHFNLSLPQSLDEWRLEACWTFVKGLSVDNFGKLGIGEAHVNFLGRAWQGFLDLVQRSRRSLTELVPAGTAVNRDGALLEFEVKVPGKSTLRGTIVKEHGTKAFSMGRFQSCTLSTGFCLSEVRSVRRNNRDHFFRQTRRLGVLLLTHCQFSPTV